MAGIGTTGQIDRVRLAEQGADPASPPAGYKYLYTKSGGLYVKDSGGGVSGPLAAGITQAAADARYLQLAGGALTGALILAADPSAALGAASKQYVDNLLAGLAWKAPVRAATAAAGTLASSFENGDAIDGVTLATGDRILIKDQAAGAENGVYVVAASGAPARASDADSGAELLNAAVFVEEGTANADTAWVQTANAPITAGSTSLSFVKFASTVGGYADPLTTRGDLLRRGASATERLALGASGQRVVSNGTDALWGDDTSYLMAVLDGGGIVPVAGVQKPRVGVPFDCTIIGVRLLGDAASGSCVVDVGRQTYAGYDPASAGTSLAGAGTKPTIAAAAKSEDTTLTSWTTTLSQGDELGFNINSVSVFTAIVAQILVKKR